MKNQQKRKIEIIVRGVCVANKSILLCHGKNASYTYLPGGHVEFGETVSSALKRELKEEMGVPIRIKRFLGCFENHFKQKGKIHCEINLVFEFTISASQKAVVNAREKHIEFLWVPLNKLKEYNVQPDFIPEKIGLWLKNPPLKNIWVSCRSI
jgi:ADP-ribose pyrophosphatase YjhB (NUDIX family)